MASLIKRKNGSHELRFGKPRRTIYLGRRERSELLAWRDHVEHILLRRESGRPVCAETDTWLQSLSDRDHKRLADKDLVEPREAMVAERLFGLLAIFIADREAKVKPSSVEVYKKVAKNLKTFFKANPFLHKVTPEMADRFWRHLLTEGNYRHGKGLAVTTSSKRMEIVRDIFSFAIKRKYLRADANPFAKQQQWKFAFTDELNKVFIDHEKIRRVVADCPKLEFKLIIMLARFLGLRMPSELLVLKWADVRWGESEIFIDSPKTGLRKCPIFPEVLPFLEAWFEQTPDGEEHIIHRHRYEKRVNYRNHLERYCKYAGIVPWPRLWHNLRLSRQTELMDVYPIATVCEWLGNSPDVAAKHYTATKPVDVQRAKTERTSEVEFSLD